MAHSISRRVTPCLKAPSWYSRTDEADQQRGERRRGHGSELGPHGAGAPRGGHAGVMTERAQQLLAQVLQLPEDERAELVAQLLASFDRGTEEVERVWAEEVERRIEGYLSGRDKAVPWDEVKAEGRRRLRKA